MDTVVFKRRQHAAEVRLQWNVRASVQPDGVAETIPVWVAHFRTLPESRSLCPLLPFREHHGSDSRRRSSPLLETAVVMPGFGLLRGDGLVVNRVLGLAPDADDLGVVLESTAACL